MFKRSSEVVRVRNPINFDPLQESSSDTKIYSCEFCEQEWQSETELHYHKRSHFMEINKDSQFCWTCIRSFKTKEYFETHFKVCHLLSSLNAQQVEREIFACNDCESIFFNKKMLILHMKIKHHRDCSEKQVFDCPVCEKTANIKNAWSHMHLHGMVGLRICAICFKGFLSWKSLRKHSNKHQSHLHCDICNISYDKVNIFTHHVENHNVKILDEPVDNEEEMAAVNKYFIPKNYTIKKGRYQNLLPYHGLKLQADLSICILCRAICTTYKERKEHILQHNTVVLETLDIKEKCVTTVDQLNIKLDAKEEGQPKFACSCGETFAFKILLKQHLLYNKGSEFVHEELSERDIAHLITIQDGYTIIEIVDEK